MAILLVIIGMICIQLGATLAKSLFPLIGPIPTVVLRITFSALILLFIWRPWRARLTKSSLLTVIGYGSVLGLMNMTFYLSLERIPLGICVALEFLGPLSLALFSSKKKIDVVWALFAAIGVYLVLPLETSESALDFLGIFFALFAGACWALYIVFGKRLGQLVDGGLGASLGMIAASVVIIPFGMPVFDFSKFTPSVLGWAVGLALLSSAIPYSLEMFAMRRVPIRTFSILMSIEPAGAALAGWVILGEQLTLAQRLAVLCVVIASAGSSITAKSATAERL